MKDFLVLGDGFLSKEFQASGFDFKTFKIKNTDSCYKDFFTEMKKSPQFIINTIAMTDTKLCEKEPQKCYEINSFFPAFLADFCKVTGRKLIQISTGCVYGNSEGAKETDFCPENLSVYCRSKLFVDRLIEDYHLVIRPRLLFSETRKHPKNLIDRLKKFNKFTEEINSITKCIDIVNATVLLKNQTGIFNIKSFDTSMYQLAQNLNLKGEKISSSSLDNNLYPNVIMDTTKFENFKKIL